MEFPSGILAWIFEGGFRGRAATLIFKVDFRNRFSKWRLQVEFRGGFLKSTLEVEIRGRILWRSPMDSLEWIYWSGFTRVDSLEWICRHGLDVEDLLERIRICRSGFAGELEPLGRSSGIINVICRGGFMRQNFDEEFQSGISKWNFEVDS